MARFDEIKVGDVAELEHTVTKQDIERFVELTGDDNRLHVDAEYAARTSFKKPVAHGMLGAAFISTIIGTKLPGDGALWFAQNLEFLLPVRIGDHLTVRAEVLKKEERLRVVELQTEIFNQHRQKVTTGIAKVKIVEEEKATVAQRLVAHKVALVVGGSGGIGAAVCRALAQDGFDVAVHCFKNANSAKKVADSISSAGKQRALAVQADIGIEADVVNMVGEVSRRLGVPTVLVNCATSGFVPVKFDELTWRDLDQHISIAVKGAWNLAHHLVPVMKNAGRGKIIQLTSQVVEMPANDLLPYITAKSAIAGFCRALALDLAPKGICVNMVSPGMTDTELIADVPERIRLLTAAKTPLRRLAKPEDVAGAVAFLASERADFLTGETIRVNGGQVML
jgi:3-oxoacyl-[acyl-carrier protein] reductase